jgi:hypothetical protein
MRGHVATARVTNNGTAVHYFRMQGGNDDFNYGVESFIMLPRVSSRGSPALFYDHSVLTQTHWEFVGPNRS